MSDPIARLIHRYPELAPCEPSLVQARDLWLAGDQDRYRHLTGRAVPQSQLDFYRLRWDLADLCSYGSWFSRPHRRTADTELGWGGCVAICQRLP